MTTRAPRSKHFRLAAALTCAALGGPVCAGVSADKSAGETAGKSADTPIERSPDWSVDFANFLAQSLTPEMEIAQARERASDQMVYLLGLFGDLPANHETAAAIVFAGAFQANYVPGNSAFTAASSLPQEAFGLINGVTIGMAEMADIQRWRIDVTLDPSLAWVPPSAYEAYVYSGSFGAALPSIGIATRIDLQKLGLPFAQSAGDWNVWAFVPLAIVDAQLISPAAVAELGAHCVNGTIGNVGGALAFLTQVGGDGVDDPMDAESIGSDSYARTGLWECLRDAALNFQQNVDNARATYDAAADPIEKKLQDLIDGALDAAGAGGAIGGLGGTSSGPTMPRAVARGGLWAALGSAFGLIRWAWSAPGPDEIKEMQDDLEELKADFKASVCAAVNQAQQEIDECFALHDPENRAAAAAMAAKWAAPYGC